MFMLQKNKSGKRENKSNQATITKGNCSTKEITHRSNEDVPEAQHTTDDVEGVNVFLVVAEEDDTEILDYNLSVIC